MNNKLEYKAESPKSISSLFEEIEKENREVSHSDPIKLNDFFRFDFIRLIQERNILALMNKLEIVTQFDPSNKIEGLSFLRDVGMIMAAIRRLDSSFSPSFEISKKLLYVSEKYGEPPRDSVFSYGPRNGEQNRRMFLGSEEEKIFIESFELGMKGLDVCLMNLALCFETNDSKKISELLTKAIEGLGSMIKGIVNVRRTITPEYFTDNMRPFFDPILIGNEKWSAPGGAQMPILIVDTILWATESDDVYKIYQKENYRYIPESYMQISSILKKNKPLDEYILGLNNTNGNNTENIKNALQILRNFINRLSAFRTPHLRVAEANFSLRGTNAVGSGGYTPDILKMILQKTKDYSNKIETQVSNLK